MKITRKLRRLLLALFLAGPLIGCREQPLIPTPLPPPSLPETALPTPLPSATERPSPLFLPMIQPESAAVEATTAAPSPVTTPTPLPTITPTPLPAFPQYIGVPLRRDLIGVQIHLHREEMDLLFSHLAALNVGWVKTQLSWKLFEPRPGEYDPELLAELDHLVVAMQNNGIQLLLGLAKAPDWSRTTTEEDGPPADPAHFEAFASFIASRYQGQVAAYELWNETNLQREWQGAPLSGTAFVELLATGAAGIRAADPQAVIISGAPAPTGINDGVTAVDDRVYLQQMVAAGLGRVVDGVGIHPYGWANPPEATVAQPDPAVPSHNNHPSFFFLDTIMDYRAILDEAGLAHLPLWTTEFGWGSFDQFDQQPPAEAAFMAAVDEWQQAVYTLRAFEMGQELVWMGPMILWNLNFAPTLGSDFSESGYSMLRPDGLARPIYHSLAAALNP
jgi:polysaccharide biosynthesis protein PslG